MRKIVCFGMILLLAMVLGCAAAGVETTIPTAREEKNLWKSTIST